MKKVYHILFALHLFVGTGAMVGGAAAILKPYEPLGMTVEALGDSPFQNFLLPGIILFNVIGVGNVFTAVMFRFRLKYQGYISSVFSWALVVWIVVQCIMLNAVAFLHILFFTIGILEAGLSMSILFEKRLFPVNILMDLYDKIKMSKKREA
jgi:hypothetical protein